MFDDANLLPYKVRSSEDIHPLNTPLKSCEALVKLLVYILAISILVLLDSCSKPAGHSGVEY